MSLTRITVAIGLYVLGLGLAAQAEEPARRPNFLFVYTDDQRYDALGVVQREQGERGRFPWFETPHMDRLAAGGVRFRNAFVTLSLCAPSRACFLTGRYNHFNGVASNFRPFPVDNVTHATLLRAAGYVTGYIGKWHMDSQRGKRPGFDYSASFIGHARYQDAPFEIDGVSTETRGWVDDVSTDYAIQFMRAHRDRPWSLVVGFKSPHGPFEPPDRARERFAGCEARPVPNLDVPPPYRVVARMNRPDTTDAKPATVPVNLNYFRCISAVDDNLGRLLDTLDEIKLTDDTVVVYASDNGFYLGEHGLGDKRSAYDESLRIPLLVRYPRLAPRGKTIDAMVLNIDLAPTLLDLAGEAIPEAMQGRSWRPLLSGQPDDWRQSYFYEYFWEPQKGSPPTMTALRTTAAKLIKYAGHDEWTELFDLQADPYETRNLAADPAHAALRARLEAEYQRQAEAVHYRVPDYAEDPAQFPPPRQVLNAYVLDYDFTAAGDRITDASGKGNHGVDHGTASTAGRKGKQARQFDGQGYIEVANAPTLDPSEGPWTIEVTLRADRPSGVILARGGPSQGYAIHLREGRPTFTVVANQRATTIQAEESTVGKWVRLEAVIGAKRELILRLDGQIAARGRLPEFIGRDPNDTMQIGADRANQVTAYETPSGLVGLVESVKLYSGPQ